MALVHRISAEDRAEFDVRGRTSAVAVRRLGVVAPGLPDEDNRIARQQGLFVAGFHPRDLGHVTIDRIYFRQIPGETFEDPAAADGQ